jgi:hypothetical protein
MPQNIPRVTIATIPGGALRDNVPVSPGAGVPLPVNADGALRVLDAGPAQAAGTAFLDEGTHRVAGPLRVLGWAIVVAAPGEFLLCDAADVSEVGLSTALWAFDSNKTFTAGGKIGEAIFAVAEDLFVQIPIGGRMTVATEGFLPAASP